jgi:hypothetical protein
MGRARTAPFTVFLVVTLRSFAQRESRSKQRIGICKADRHPVVAGKPDGPPDQLFRCGEPDAEKQKKQKMLTRIY